LAEHILKVVPKSAKVVFENDKIRVIEIVMRKGQKLAMHSHMPSLAYGITSSKFKATSPDGKSRVVRMKKGDASWSDGRSHSVENLGGLSRALSIELKG
jgi:beta-alanine degradation protein BauB